MNISSNTREHLSKWILIIQVISAIIITTGGFVVIIHSVEGQSLSHFILVQVFLVLQLCLASESHKENPTKATGQSVMIYKMWIFFTAVTLFGFWLNGTYAWCYNDSLTMASVFIGTVAVMFSCRWYKISCTKHPISKGMLAILYKSLPQFMMALKIIAEGASGIPFSVIVFANVSISTRIMQIQLAVRESGWDQNQLWLFISECANQVSYLTVTLAWLLWKFHTA